MTSPHRSSVMDDGGPLKTSGVPFSQRSLVHVFAELDVSISSAKGLLSLYTRAQYVWKAEKHY